MKEFVDKPIGRLEEYKSKRDEEDRAYIHCEIDNVISIVKELAEEHKGGWIPCSSKVEEPQWKKAMMNTFLNRK